MLQKCLFGVLVMVTFMLTIESAILKPTNDFGVDVYHYNAYKEPKTKCMADLGCFSLDDDFYHRLYRPINSLPADRESINTKFLLHTANNVKQFHYIRAKDKKSMENSDFNPERETKIIIHGYIDNQLYGEWMRKMKNEFLMHGDYNVIIVDWSGGNQLPYVQATANTRVVGAEIAFLVNYLEQNYGLNPENVHILGHSLGSHVAGYAGERIKNLGRITGMDPAEPFFQGLPARVKLDPTDANFVDIIHTDSKSILQLGLGMSELVGHVDFFPNNGKENPGCIKDRFTKIFTDGIVDGARSFVACNHHRAVDFMLDSINDHQCNPVSYMCADWQTFLSGKCSACGRNGERCAIMGMRAIEYLPFKKNDESKKFYSQTSDKSPFCFFSYLVSIRLQSGYGKDRTGSLKFKIRGQKRDESFTIKEGKYGLYPGSTYSAMVTTTKDLGDIEGVIIEWEASTFWSVFAKQEIYPDTISVVPLNIIDSKIRETSKRNYCNEKGKALASKEQLSFYVKNQLC